MYPHLRIFVTNMVIPGYGLTLRRYYPAMSSGCRTVIRAVLSSVEECYLLSGIVVCTVAVRWVLPGILKQDMMPYRCVVVVLNEMGE